MAAIPRIWRNWVHGRKFAKKGKKCRFTGKFLHVDGHVELGDYCRIREYCILRTNGDGKIIFGDRSGCSNNVIIEATTEIRIGNGTGLAEFVVVRDTDHLVYGTDANWRYTPQIARPVTIGNECLIGSRAYISPGVTIGDGAVVHAGSVVSKDIGPYEIWAGMPARFVAHRTDNVPPSKMRQFRDLIEKYGIRDDRRADELERADDKDV